MKIEVAVKTESSPKSRGDLLENLSKKLLESQNYEVDTEIRNTGMELDLLCKNKANSSKKIYVECKAYKESNKIQADVIKNIVGIKTIKNYSEVWLICTTELGKDAKGLQKEIEEGSSSSEFTFYTKDRLAEALQSSKTICNHEIAKAKFLDLNIRKNKMGNEVLLITEYGYFWLFEYLEAGSPNDVLVSYAINGEIVKEKSLLTNLLATDNSLNKYNFYKNIELLNDNKVSIPLEINDNFTLNENYLKSINDTGIKFTHPNKNELTLPDFFIYQDLQDIENDKKLRVNSEKLLSLNNYSNCVVFGEEVSGKTSLITTLQKEYNAQGLIPIYFDAKYIKNSNYDKFEIVLFKNFKKQYKEIDDQIIKGILKSNSERIIILIDNFEILGIKKIEYKSKFLEMIYDKFLNIFIFADDSFEMELMTKKELKGKLIDFKFFKIKEYGHKLRDDIIEKWLTIGVEETIEDNVLLERKDEVFKMIETVIGNKFIPTYPLYIITLLQQIEAGTSNNLGGSAYAEFYNYLINQAMGTTRIKADELDFYHTYLSFIAYNYFIQGRKELDKTEMENLHDIYSTEYHMKPFTQVYDNLISAKLLKEDIGIYSFGHNYIYYFYVAKYLSDNMEKRGKKEEIIKQIDMLIERLYRTEFANIIIFLIHHSKTRAELVIDKIMGVSKEIFKDIAPSALSEEELIRINELVSEEMKIIIDDKSPHIHRKEKLELKDKMEPIENGEENGTIPRYNEDIPELDIFGKINLSTKIMEILGQITKNYYGSLTKGDKFYILSELSNLGLRNLNLFLKQFSEYRDLLEKDIREKIEKKNIIGSTEIEKISKRIIFNFAELISITFMKKISNNMASKNLFDSVEEVEVGCEAKKLINMAIKLDFPGGLNKEKILALDYEFSNNMIAKELLKFFVIEHMYKFDVNFKKRQEICEKLNIGIQVQKNILIKKSNK